MRVEFLICWRSTMDHHQRVATTKCCAKCGEEEGGVSLKACKSCMLVKYCNANCQRNHWPKHKKDCKLRAAELWDEALFKEPPPKEDCPICFSTNASNFDMLCLASGRNYIIRANFTLGRSPQTTISCAHFYYLN